MEKIMMLAGEPSGDLHGSNLAIELKKLSPGIELFGIGGGRMKNAGVNILFGLKDLAVTGLLDVIKNYFKLKKIQTILLSKIKAEKISLIILIDYPDFNLRFAKLAHRFGTPMIYYISPQVWAWRRGRIKLIKKYVKKIFVFFKFEEELYKKAGVPVEFIGHPLLDVVRPSAAPQGPRDPVTQYAGELGNWTIALLPGSRKQLIKMHLPIMLKSAEIIYKRFPQTKFLISKLPSVDNEVYINILNKFNLPVTLLEDKTYDIINTSDIVLTVSGTATLETAILEKPMVIIYKLPLFEYLLARPLLRLRLIGLVNIVAGKEIVPEFVQFKARPKIIAKNLIDILTDKQKYGEIKINLAAVKNSLYPAGASKRAAASILSSTTTLLSRSLS